MNLAASGLRHVSHLSTSIAHNNGLLPALINPGRTNDISSVLFRTSGGLIELAGLARLWTVSCILRYAVLGGVREWAPPALLGLVAPSSDVAVQFTFMKLILVDHSPFYEGVWNVRVSKLDNDWSCLCFMRFWNPRDSFDLLSCTWDRSHIG